jgi:3-deoxy-D-arabino-heptulosonate 7-phosphate (DAHP) synthase class II
VAIASGVGAVTEGVHLSLAKIVESVAADGANILNSTLPSTFSVIGDPRLNEINGLRWFLC